MPFGRYEFVAYLTPKRIVPMTKVLSKETISLLVSLVNDNREQGHGKFYADIQGVADCLRSDGITEQVSFYGYAPCEDEQPVAPQAPVVSKETIAWLVSLINHVNDHPHDMGDDAIVRTADYLRSDGVIEKTGDNKYAVCEDEQPEAPVVPVISPATIRLLVRTLNTNSHTALFNDCTAINTLRTSAIRDGIIKEVDSWICESCVDEPVEAPVVPFVQGL
jgi:hypothetical protein